VADNPNDFFPGFNSRSNRLCRLRHSQAARDLQSGSPAEFAEFTALRRYPGK
jgi:hypothetical protein